MKAALSDILMFKAFWMHATKYELYFEQPQVTRMVTNEL